MNEELNKAFEQISDDHINEAAHYRKPRLVWLRAIAAVLAIVIAWTAIWAALDFPPNFIYDPDPTVPTINGKPKPQYPSNLGGIQSPGTLQLSNMVAAPMYPQMAQYPDHKTVEPFSDAYYAQLSKWLDSQAAQYDQPEGYADSLNEFWSRSIAQFLSGEGNRAYSPVNVYIALAMLAEATDGNSRQQILDLLGADSIEDLRTQASYIWNAQYCNDQQTTSLLANSLWLDDSYTFKDSAAQNLVNHYYASIFNGDLPTKEMSEQLQTWLNSQTGGLLQEQVKNQEFSEYAVFALASTIYFTAGWSEEFDPTQTDDAVFHCKNGDLTTAFMNKTMVYDTYYWGNNFTAVRLGLSKGGMWLILPDEGVPVEKVLNSDEYLKMVQSPTQWKNKKNITINLSLPKFDITTDTSLIEEMQALGLSDIFIPGTADFSPLTEDSTLRAPHVGKIDHAVRIAIDEEGIVAAAYTVIEAIDTGIPMPPDEEIDFVLDRPFLFVVSSHDRLPLFAGVVEQP